MGRGRRPLLAGVLVALVVLAGCATLVEFGRQDAPASDRLGWEAGYWYDDPVAVTTADGLNESERRAVVGRAMARVERIRRLEFEKRVPVEVISRSEFRNRSGGPGSGNRSDTYGAWNNQVWEALFLVDEDTDVSAAFDAVFGSSVQGFYSPGRDRIVLVSDTETPTVDRATLAHELVHALQDQHPDLSLGGGAPTQDAQLAEDGLVEGDANAVEAEYQARCEAGWSCIDRPPRGGGGTPADFNRGVFLTIFTPYASGPGFVSALRDRGGWDAVDRAYDRFPRSTEQIIHPSRYPDEQPVNVTVRDRSGGDWERFDLDRQADTVGEASVYAMFWANGQVDREGSPYRYLHPLSTGWGGDAVVPYRDGDEFGYVWKSVWDSRTDAELFLEGYRGVLDEHGATEVAEGVYVIPESDGFADAFRVTRRGDTVVVVNAPSRDALDGVHRPR